MSSGQYPEFWPAWLADDVPESAIWNLEHETAPTIFRGASMHLVDRANNLLPLLLSEPKLASCWRLAFDDALDRGRRINEEHYRRVSSINAAKIYSEIIRGFDAS